MVIVLSKKQRIGDLPLPCLLATEYLLASIDWGEDLIFFQATQKVTFLSCSCKSVELWNRQLSSNNRKMETHWYYMVLPTKRIINFNFPQYFRWGKATLHVWGFLYFPPIAKVGDVRTMGWWGEVGNLQFYWAKYSQIISSNLFVFLNILIPGIYIYIYTYVYIYNTHTYIYINMCIYVYIYIYIYLHKIMYIEFLSKSICLSLYIYIRIYTWLYIQNSIHQAVGSSFLGERLKRWAPASWTLWDATGSWVLPMGIFSGINWF